MQAKPADGARGSELADAVLADDVAVGYALKNRRGRRGIQAYRTFENLED
jgi:hypothetical protein